MNGPTSDRASAVQRAEKKLGFFIHLGIYVIVNAALITINLMKSPDHLWFYWPLLGWGIGIALHACKVFCTSGTSPMSKLKQRMVEHELERERESEGPSTSTR